ncbi:MAG: ectoine/hydroxyectoine ABC transporter substrate-binding protein EhuB [Rubellimicrobium sp.]|nr:ectoine/hydroxyectoine ABC transporter substrate-binding protein EhuB [Rubellimicrobium sp.]
MTSTVKTLITAGFALGVSAAAVMAGPLMDRIDAGDSIRIGFANEIPFAYADEAGNAAGFVNAMTLDILQNMGYTNIEAVQTEWGGLIPGLNAGRFDIVTGGMNILASRCENMAFSEPIATIGDGFIVAPGNPKGLETYEGIHEAGATLVTGAGYSNIEAAKAAGMTDADIMIVPGPTEILAAVVAGRADAGTGTYFTMAQLAASSDGKVEVTDPNALPEETFNWAGIGFRFEDQDFLDAFNAALADYIGSDQMMASVAQYGYTEDTLPGDRETAWVCENR